MSYVDAFFNRDSDTIHVVERTPKGKRIFVEYPVKHTFYYADPKGKQRSIYDTPVTRVVCKNTKEFRKELRVHDNKQLFESDLNPIFVCLSENYLNAEPPKLNVAYWDIEVDFDPERGYAAPDDAFMPITSIAVYLQWLETMVCLAVPPKTLSMEEATELVKDFPNTILFNTEAELLDTFLDLIQDADVISGWNSEGFDIPYTVNRITKTLSKEDTKRLCLFNQHPIRREYEKYGKAAVTYDLVGRIHLDSLELYRKYTYEERHSYSLDSIAEYELGERKTEYEGTLDQLYNNDFKTFIEYNRQDTMLLEKLDRQLKFLDIANVLAHECTVLLPTTMGAVAVTEQSIINEAHRRGYVVQNRKKKDPEAVTDDEGAAGAYVAYPKKGIHDWVGSLDINSLYPSVIRALNMGPETIIGQIRQDMTNEYLRKEKSLGKTITAAWESKFGSLEYDLVMEKDTGTILTIDWEDGSEDTVNAETVYRLLFESKQPWMLSANGTIFTHEREGIIPGLLKRWYAERKEMQAKKKEASASGDKVLEEYWDKRQHVKKIVLNSLYGAILNAGCRFYDKRIGQSVTLTGKSIARHMGAQVNAIITGEYTHLGKSIIYQDTDSEVASTVHQTNYGELTIEEMFENCSEYWDDGDKEYAYDPDLMVMSYDKTRDEPYLGHINYIYRHKVTKDLYEIVDELGNSITVTEDHSVMVERNWGLIEVKPTEILENDILISIMINGEIEQYKKQFVNMILNNDEEDQKKSLTYLKQGIPKKTIALHRGKVQSVKKVKKAEDEYVYDIGMANESQPWYFGNNILIHNSVYFSAYETLKSEIDNGNIPWSKEDVVGLYDKIGDEVNKTFTQFMLDACHCPKTRGEVIRAGREIVGSKALFIIKKRYAVLVYDKEGKRLDKDGSSGEIKAMGLDLKRSDTPVFMQNFLAKVLEMVLTGETEQSILKSIAEFRTVFKSRPGWEKGSPKRANKITKYQAKEAELGKANMPGHVRASVNWNTLKQMYGDKYSMNITDGAKVIVCKLKHNPLGFTSVAYPVDEMRLPQWFKDLPFDHNAMEAVIIDKKVSNLIGVLNWDLFSTTERTSADDLFTFH